MEDAMASGPLTRSPCVPCAITARQHGGLVTKASFTVKQTFHDTSSVSDCSVYSHNWRIRRKHIHPHRGRGSGDSTGGIRAGTYPKRLERAIERDAAATLRRV